jgi:hypothetical protein
MESYQHKQAVMGPVDWLVVRFPGNRLRGKIAPELRRLEDAGIVRVIDLVFIRKDQDGNVASFEISDLGGENENTFHVFSSRVDEWLSQEDIDSIGSELPNNSAAGAILFENLWAVRLKEAMLDSGGELIGQGRVSPELIDKVREKIESTRSR